MVDDQKGRLPKWKTTKMEDDQNGRRPKWKTTRMEDDQNGSCPKWKTTKIEDDQNGRQLSPSLFLIFSPFFIFFHYALFFTHFMGMGTQEADAFKGHLVQYRCSRCCISSASKQHQRSTQYHRPGSFMG